MEVKIEKRYPMVSSVEQAWAVLADLRATAACMPGAQISEQIDSTHFKGIVRSKVGPAVMQFLGDIEVLELDAANRRLKILGKGADKAGSSAQMTLDAQVIVGEGSSTSVLVGQAIIVVSGKLAQFGSRLLVPVSDAMLAQFADNFRSAAAVAISNVTPMAERDADDDRLHAEHQMVQGASQPAPAIAVPQQAAPVKELNALALLWTVVRNWLTAWVGAKR